MASINLAHQPGMHCGFLCVLNDDENSANSILLQDLCSALCMLSIALMDFAVVYTVFPARPWIPLLKSSVRTYPWQG